MLWDEVNGKNQMYSLDVSTIQNIHDATDVSLAQWNWNTNQNLEIAFMVFTLIIMFGSIHIDWHYVLDGYVGCIRSCAIWHLVGWMQRKSHLNDASRTLSVKTLIIPSAS